MFSNAFFEEICFPLEADHFHPFEWVANFVVSLVAEYQRNKGMKVYIGIEYCLCRNKFMSLTTSLNCSPVAISSLVIDISSLGSSYLSKSCPCILHQSNSWCLSRFDCCILLLLVILTTIVADANPKLSLSLSLSLLLLFLCLSPPALVVVNHNVVSAGHNCLSIVGLPHPLFPPLKLKPQLFVVFLSILARLF